MSGTGHILALDLHPHKVKLIAEQAARLGLENIETRAEDARTLQTKNTMTASLSMRLVRDLALFDASLTFVGRRQKRTLNTLPMSKQRFSPMQASLSNRAARLSIARVPLKRKRTNMR